MVLYYVENFGPQHCFWLFGLTDLTFANELGVNRTDSRSLCVWEFVKVMKAVS